MNETKKVNEISSKKNFGKYSQKIHRRSHKAITLIALIVTIIILLILTGVSATILIGDNSIINKAKYAREVSRGSAVKEYVDMAELNNILSEYVKKNNITRSQAIYELHKDGKLTDKEVMLLNTQDVITIGGINIDFSILGTPEVGKVYIAWRGVGFYAQSDGKLYSFNSTRPTYYDKDFDLTYIRDDIKKYYGKAYLTNSNELYGYDSSSKQYEKVTYLTNSNELYVYNSSSKQYERVGEAKDLKKYYGTAYLTNSNELYKYNGSQYEKVVDNVKELKGSYYITNSDEIYVYNIDHHKYEKIEVNVGDIKEFGEDYFITKDNKIRALITGDGDDNVMQ